jgi:hypothetical protein
MKYPFTCNPGVYPINVSGMFVLLIVAVLSGNIQYNIQAANRTYRQTNDVNNTEGFVSKEIAKGDFQVVADHEGDIWEMWERI